MVFAIEDTHGFIRLGGIGGGGGVVSEECISRVNAFYGGAYI